MATNERNFQTIEYYRRESKFRRQYNEGLQSHLEEHGLSLLEAEILFAIFADPSCDTVTKLCADIGKTKGIVSLSCDRLIKQKYLSSRIDKKDRRVVHFHLLSAAKKVIDSVSRYMEIMNDVQRAKEEGENADLIMRAMLDTENGRIYPITCKICDFCRFPDIPFRSYQTFLEEQCLTRVPSDQLADLSDRLALAAITKAADTDLSIRVKVPFQTTKGLYGVTFEVIPFRGLSDTAEFMIRFSEDAAN